MDQSLKQCRSWGMGSAMGRACAVLLMLGSVQPALAQQTVAGKPVAVAAVSPQTVVAAPAAAKPGVEEKETAKPSKPGSEGIKVHGHWVLQVRNADGTLGERREFDNSLVTSFSPFIGGVLSTSGAAMLAAALTGDVAVGNPAIGFVTGPASSFSVTPDVWCNPSGDGTVLAPNLTCYVYATTNSLWNLTPVSGSTLGGVSLGLNLTVSFTNSANFVLTGNYTVPSGLTQINAVQSLYGVCAPKSSAYVQPLTNGNSPNTYYLSGAGFPVRTADVAATTCTASAIASSTTDVPLLAALTSTIVTAGGVATPLNVTAGQIVTVTVTLSFS